MASDTDHDITIILHDFGGAEHDSAVARLLPQVYRELRSLAAAYLRAERPDHTLQATALVHEAYVRLAGSANQQWDGRAHFFRVAAKAMRHILISHARGRKAAKRGGGAAGVALSDTALVGGDEGRELLEIDDALRRLAERDREKAEVFELRFFGGHTTEETAETLGLSIRTVERRWRFARAWLASEMGADG